MINEQRKPERITFNEIEVFFDGQRYVIATTRERIWGVDGYMEHPIPPTEQELKPEIGDCILRLLVEIIKHQNKVASLARELSETSGQRCTYATPNMVLNCKV